MLPAHHLRTYGTSDHVHRQAGQEARATPAQTGDSFPAAPSVCIRPARRAQRPARRRVALQTYSCMRRAGRHAATATIGRHSARRHNGTSAERGRGTCRCGGGKKCVLKKSSLRAAAYVAGRHAPRLQPRAAARAAARQRCRRRAVAGAAGAGGEQLLQQAGVRAARRCAAGAPPRAAAASRSRAPLRVPPRRRVAVHGVAGCSSLTPCCCLLAPFPAQRGARRNAAPGGDAADSSLDSELEAVTAAVEVRSVEQFARFPCRRFWPSDANAVFACDVRRCARRTRS
jgi:hypothetical protein